MSCIMSSPQQLSILTTAIERLLNMGYEFNGYDAPEELHKALCDCCDRYQFYDAKQIFCRLYQLNAAAYNGRYHGAPTDPVMEEIPEMPEAPRMVERVKWSGGHWELQHGHYKLLKLLSFYNYQCNEDTTSGADLTKAMNLLEQRLMAFIIGNTPEYHEIKWGEV